MRIGRVIIDTDNMSVQDMDVIIRELRNIRARKLKAEELKSRMLELIADAKENGFTFIDKDFGQVWTSNDVELYDEQT
jgi:spore germination protein YaaH